VITAHWTLIATLIVVWSAQSAAVSAQAPTDVEIDRAIEMGLNGRELFGAAECSSRGPAGGNGGFRITIRGPLGRIAQAAYRMRGRSASSRIARQDLPDDLGGSELVVEAWPFNGQAAPAILGVGADPVLSPPITNILLRPRAGKSNDVTPSRATPLPLDTRFVTGGQFSGQGMLAWFDRQQVPEAFSVTIESLKGSRWSGCPVSPKDLQSLWNP
jgi:hypothetical protein